MRDFFFWSKDANNSALILVYHVTVASDKTKIIHMMRIAKSMGLTVYILGPRTYKSDHVKPHFPWLYLILLHV